ncbi:MAG: hypothetical protein H6522_05795 [Mycolicibacterium sp.]|nr:hypothetical protein [Mycolicibacterium sp.]
MRIIGGPGTGKSGLLVEAAAAHIAAGVDPESVLLTGSGRLAGATRSALTATLLAAAGGAAGSSGSRWCAVVPCVRRAAAGGGARR